MTEPDDFLDSFEALDLAPDAQPRVVAERPRPEVPVTGLVEIDSRDYFADPCPEPSLTQSIATVLVQRSPLHAWHAHPRLGAGREEEDSAGQTTGTLVHSLLLGGASLRIVDHRDWRTKDARAQKALALAEGKLPILAHEHAELIERAEAIREQFVAQGVDFLAARNEVCAFWLSRDDGGREVQCRAMIDSLKVDLDWNSAEITDLKTAHNGHPLQFERHADRYGYDIQAAAYVEAIETIYPQMAGRVTYRWAVVEPEPPHSPYAPSMTGELRELGSLRWRRAVNAWSECTRSGHWPGYDDGSVVRIGALPWAMKREMEG